MSLTDATGTGQPRLRLRDGGRRTAGRGKGTMGRRRHTLVGAGADLVAQVDEGWGGDGKQASQSTVDVTEKTAKESGRVYPVRACI